MDRPLDPVHVRATRRRRRLLVVAGLGVLGAGYAWAPALLRPTVARERLRVATVERGPVEASLTASGVVLPATEQVVVSPVDARVVAVVRRAGDEVREGDALLQLDLAATRLDVENLSRAVALKQNQQRRTRLDLQRALADLAARREIKALQLEQLRATLQRTRDLAREGLVAAESLQAAELAERQAAIELRQLAAETSATEARTRAELEGLDLEMGSARGDLEASRARLDQASLRAEGDGVVTWALAEPGVMVRRGDPVVRVADLGSFRVQATAADVHARTLSPGLPVRVKAGDNVLEGAVATVEPAIRDGVVTFEVALADARNRLLRSNQRVDVHVLTGRRADAVRVERGPGLHAGTDLVFVLEGSRLRRVPVRVGLVGFDRVEVVEGLAPGQQVVVSDMAAWRHAERLRVD